MIDRSPDELRKGAEVEGRDAGFRQEVADLNATVDEVIRRREAKRAVGRIRPWHKPTDDLAKPLDDDGRDRDGAD